VTGEVGTTGVVVPIGTGFALGRVGCVGCGLGFGFGATFFGAGAASGITAASTCASAIPASTSGVAGVVAGDSFLQPKRTATTTARTRSAMIAANACLIDTWKRCHVRSRITSEFNESSYRVRAWEQHELAGQPARLALRVRSFDVSERHPLGDVDDDMTRRDRIDHGLQARSRGAAENRARAKRWHQHLNHRARAITRDHHVAPAGDE
jgi:hypothetical protein